MQIAAGGPSGSGIGPEKSGPLFGPLGVKAKGYNLSFRPHFTLPWGIFRIFYTDIFRGFICMVMTCTQIILMLYENFIIICIEIWNLTCSKAHFSFENINYRFMKPDEYARTKLMWSFWKYSLTGFSIHSNERTKHTRHTKRKCEGRRNAPLRPDAMSTNLSNVRTHENGKSEQFVSRLVSNGVKVH